MTSLHGLTADRPVCGPALLPRCVAGVCHVLGSSPRLSKLLYLTFPAMHFVSRYIVRACSKLFRDRFWRETSLFLTVAGLLIHATTCGLFSADNCSEIDLRKNVVIDCASVNHFPDI